MVELRAEVGKSGRRAGRPSRHLRGRLLAGHHLRLPFVELCLERLERLVAHLAHRRSTFRPRGDHRFGLVESARQAQERPDVLSSRRPERPRALNGPASPVPRTARNPGGAQASDRSAAFSRRPPRGRIRAADDPGPQHAAPPTAPSRDPRSRRPRQNHPQPNPRVRRILLQ